MTEDWMYLSFTDYVDGVDTFLGACVVRGSNVLEAAFAAHLLGINPGGQVLGIGPLSAKALDTFSPEYRERLLDKRTMMEELQVVRVGDLEQEGSKP